MSTLLSRKWRQRSGSPPSDDEKTSRNGKNHASPRPYSSENGGGGASTFGSAPGTRLAQEIHDEFLVCKICLECYKNPKCLNCLHTFCEHCIENHVNSESSYKKYSDYREFTCPLCRKRTQLPMGGVKKLPDNFLVSSLTEVVSRQRPSQSVSCDICKTVNKKDREATSKCLDCSKLLCSGCVELHKATKVTSGHSLFDVDIEKDIECKEHKDEVVRFYCEPCDACICVLCTFNEHKDHEITQFGDAVLKYKQTIQTLLDKSYEKIQSFDDQVESLEKCETIIKGVQQKVHDTAIQFIQDVRNKEKQMIEELENVYGTDCMERIANKKGISSQIENLRSTCNLTKVILTGKDIELLLLKKDVQDKLDSLNSFTVKGLPGTVDKVVEFFSGSVDFGYIHDHDRPLLSTNLKLKRPSDANNSDYFTHTITRSTATAETQTEPDLTKVKAPEPGEILSSSEESSDDSDSDDSDSDESSSGDSSDSSSDKEEEEKKEVEVQTENSGLSDTSVATMTETCVTEDKAVNTLMLQGSSSFDNDLTHNDSGEDGTDNSLAARRRRRRQRAQGNLTTPYSGSVDSGSYSGLYQSNSGVGAYQSRSAGTYSRSSYGSRDDSYYDTGRYSSRI